MFGRRISLSLPCTTVRGAEKINRPYSIRAYVTSKVRFLMILSDCKSVQMSGHKYARKWWGVMLVITVVDIAACTLAPTRIEKSTQAWRAVNEDNCDLAEVLFSEVAQGTDRESYKAREKLVEMYDRFYHDRQWPSCLGSKNNPQKELYWRMKIVEHPLFAKEESYSVQPGNQQSKIAGLFRDGLGAPRDITQACAWYEKAYKAGDRDSVTELSKHCASLTTVEAARDPVFVAWVDQYPVECDGGRRAKLPQCLGKGCRKACDGPSLTLPEYRQSRGSSSK